MRIKIDNTQIVEISRAWIETDPDSEQDQLFVENSKAVYRILPRSTNTLESLAFFNTSVKDCFNQLLRNGYLNNTQVFIELWEEK